MIGPESLSPNIPTEEKLSSQKTPEEIADKLQSFTNVVDKSNYWKKLSPEKRQAVISFLTTENQKDTDKKTQNTDKKTQNTEKKTQNTVEEKQRLAHNSQISAQDAAEAEREDNLAAQEQPLDDTTISGESVAQKTGELRQNTDAVAVFEDAKGNAEQFKSIAAAAKKSGEMADLNAAKKKGKEYAGATGHELADAEDSEIKIKGKDVEDEKQNLKNYLAKVGEENWGETGREARKNTQLGTAMENFFAKNKTKLGGGLKGTAIELDVNEKEFTKYIANFFEASCHRKGITFFNPDSADALPHEVAMIKQYKELMAFNAENPGVFEKLAPKKPEILARRVAEFTTTKNIEKPQMAKIEKEFEQIPDENYQVA